MDKERSPWAKDYFSERIDNGDYPDYSLPIPKKVELYNIVKMVALGMNLMILIKDRQTK